MPRARVGALAWLQHWGRARGAGPTTRGYARMRVTGAPAPATATMGLEHHHGDGELPCVLWEALGAAEGVCERGGTFGCRESIFKISHTKLELFFHFPDTRSDVAREPLQRARVVYEGGGKRAGRAAGARGCSASHRRPPNWPPALWRSPPKPRACGSGSPPSYRPVAQGPTQPQASWAGCRPGEDVRPWLGTSPGVATLRLLPNSDRAALA